VERATLTTVDGVRLAAVIRRAQPSLGCVVVAHGFAASAEERGVVALADALAGAHYDVVTYDSRGHGRSGGRCTLGDLERHDVSAASDAIAGGDPVILVGVSMGAIAVLHHASRPRTLVPEVGAVVTLSAPAHWRLPRTARGVMSAGVTATAIGRAFAARRLGVRLAPSRSRPDPPVELLRRVTAPVAIVHAIDDPFLPRSNADALFAAAAEPRRLDLVPGRWHALDPAAVPVVVGAVDWARARITRRR
jgi:pimeloyl-ACP methyl ester carboxylesterase